METKTYTTIDKSAWPEGPWHGEPDKVQWPDKDTGLPCLAVRNHVTGSWCGYVAVSAEHPFNDLGYDDINIEVHGGLTFAGGCRGNVDEARDICHVTEPGESERVWWFGFDCAHCDDFSPAMPVLTHGIYRDLAYVQRECAELAAQLAARA